MNAAIKRLQAWLEVEEQNARQYEAQRTELRQAADMAQARFEACVNTAKMIRLVITIAENVVDGRS